ncbi:MAG: 1,6-anhydro-N-acetylmuramyl-L-alanine amidase AmpD [Methylococcaceae bacterium]|jgi:AmpD protein
MNITEHILDEARVIASPNHDSRPATDDLSLIVIHCISLPPGQFGTEGVTQLFTNTLDPTEHPYYAGIAHLRVSAHTLIRRTGEILQYVPFDRRAWHAGVSSYRGRAVCNDFSIGIELEGTDDSPYEEIQYQQLNRLVDALLRAYPGLTRANVTGHEDIAPGRKTDPGPFFDWARLTGIA